MKRVTTPKALCVLLCYNDGDILAEQIEYMRIQCHDIIVWDHGSDDETPRVLDRYQHELIERRTVPRSFDFYDLYPAMSYHLMHNHIDEYDFISWPDQDEFLEGPLRGRSYYEYLCDVYYSEYSWIQFRNFVYWYDRERPANRLSDLHNYALFGGCSPRIRAWKSEATNVRQFNHNPPKGKQYPLLFNLRHYPFRSEEHLRRRLNKDRANLRRGDLNYHYDNMLIKIDKILSIKPDMFHSDDGKSDLNLEEIFDWSIVYG
jgi:glycosyltransferase involved in cell wall biosynthesis